MEKLSYAQKVQELWVSGGCSRVQAGDGCSYNAMSCTELLCSCQSQGCCQGTPSAGTLGLSPAAGSAQIRDLGCWDGKSSRLHREPPCARQTWSLMCFSAAHKENFPYLYIPRHQQKGLQLWDTLTTFRPKSFIDPSLENTSRSPQNTKPVLPPGTILL